MNGYRRVDAATSARMKRVGQRDTAPELRARALVRGMGLRYRTTNRDLPGVPDLANRRARWAVFVHGCYWHSHAGCAKATVPTRNRALWVEKFARTVVRDRAALRALKKLGYLTVVVWECDLARSGARAARKLARLGTL
jgi:DNA mismatch endonuclease (patch repair protein)